MQKLNFISDFTEEEKRKHFEEKKQLEPMTQSLKKGRKMPIPLTKKRSSAMPRSCK